VKGNGFGGSLGVEVKGETQQHQRLEVILTTLPPILNNTKEKLKKKGVKR